MLNDSLLHNLASLHWFWQSTLCIGTGLLGSFLLRQRPTRAHQVLFWSMTAAIALPALSVLVKHYNLGLLQPVPTKTVLVSTPIPDPIPVIPVDLALPTAMPDSQDVVPASPWETSFERPSNLENIYGTELNEETYSAMLTEDSATQSTPPVSTVPPIEKKSSLWSLWVFIGWFAVSLFLLGRLLLNFTKGIRLVHNTQPLHSEVVLNDLQQAKRKLQIRPSVKIFQSYRIKTPVIWCWFSRPILLIPEQVNPSGKRIDWVSVFCHELAHWKRRDHWCCLVAEIMICLFWPNPLVWWAKQRLIRLSEQACDDWVVAAGQSKTDYADSLLNLVPQGRLTLVPTVIGGKKEMKKRIRRIIQDRADNPRISSRGTWLIGIMAICLALGLALTQTRAAERDEERERERITKEKDEERMVHPEERERKERDARFRELSRELEELKNAERNTERRLKGLRDGQDEEARDLQAQLRRIQEEMTDLKRALYESTREKQGDREREHDEHAKRRFALDEEMKNLQVHARNLEREMKELGDRHPEKRRELQNELREIQERMKNLERERRAFDKESSVIAEQEQQIVRERLMQERRELKLRDQEIRRALEEIGDDNPEKRRDLERELDNIHERILRMERSRLELERMRLDRGAQDLEVRRKELMMHQDNLRVRREVLERELKETDNDEHARNLKRDLEQTAAELRQVEQDLHQKQPERERPELSVMERHLAEMKKKIHRLAELGKHDQAEQLEREFRQAQSELQQTESQLKQDRMHMLQRLDEIKKEMMLARQQGKHDEIERLEREAQEILHCLKEQPTLPQLPRKPDMMDRDSRRMMPVEPRPELELQIQELQGQVKEMRREMKEIRSLLRELLEQKRERER